MKPLIVVLRGKPTAGKSTAFCTLRELSKMKKWIFIDNASIKRMFENIEDEKRKEIGKRVLFYTLKNAMPLKRNILIEEISKEALMKYVGKDIKEYGYNILVFQFEISFEEAMKRDKQRAKDKWHPFMGKQLLQKLHKMHEEKFDKEAILIDGEKMNKKEIIKFILKKLELK